MLMRGVDYRALIAAALSMVLVGSSAMADDIGPEVAKKLLSEGRIRPLSEILTVLNAKVPGQMLEVELELENATYVYEVKLLRPDGKVQEVKANASTGNILEIEDDD
jgi:uncharacterized membrane protein YkoI